MNKPTLLLILPFSLLFCASCHKEPADLTPVTIDLTEAAFGIIDTGTVVASDQQVKYIRIIHNKEIKSTGRGGIFTMTLDVDADEYPDFEFKLDSWSQLSGDGWSKASVKGVHGTFEINTYFTIDTTFRSDSYQVRDGSYWDKKIAIIDTRTASCRRLKDSDFVQAAGTISRINHFMEGEKNNPSPDWSREELFFRNVRYHSMFYYEQKQSADTIWFLTNASDIDDCHVFPEDTVNVWIRCTVDGAVKPGWIRLVAKRGQITVLESEIMQ